jgi:hypothetical protein
MLSLLSLLIISPLANAQQLKESSLFMKGFQVQETRLRLCSVGETWRDPSIIQQYRSNRLFGVVGISHRFHQYASVDIEAGYTRMDGNKGLTTLQLLPFTVGATALFGTSQVEPFAGMGATFVSFSEEGPQTVFEQGAISGTKLGVDLRAGVRIGTRMVQPNYYPSDKYGPNPHDRIGAKQLDFELLLGQRIHHIGLEDDGSSTIGQGFDMGAFRIGAGMLLRL